ncbi:PAS domain S-box protein [Massilia sp. S19_KUP03_FR1]|uniref:PAS domain S-box protein n=1 Tax=Massilia sp. S19_KUP03_FR1 TaxID=3025503 RepID=UPI002FCD5B48
MNLKYFARLGRPRQLMLAILLAGGAITASVVVGIARLNERVVQDHAQRAVDATLVQVDALLQRYQYGLAGLRGALAVTGPAQMDQAAFLRYSQSRNYRVEFPGARGFGFIRRVAPADTGAYIAAQRRRGRPDFALRQFQPHDGDRAIIELLAPIDANKAAIGLDIASEAVRRAGADAASASGTAALTAPLTLVQDSVRPQQGFLMLLPVYDAGRVAGWSFAPLAIHDVLANLPGSLPDGAFALADTVPGRAAYRFYAVGAGAPGSASVRQVRRVVGREWVATFQPSQAFVDQLRLPSSLQAGLAGAALTLLSAALGAALAAQRARLQRLHANQEQLVDDRTAQLDAARRDLRTILDAVPSMIGYWDDQQRNRFANRSYCALFCQTPEQLAGRSMCELLGADLYLLNAPYVDAVLRGESAVFERVVAGPDGNPRHYLANYLPDSAHGRVQGFYVLIHDVSEVVESRQALASALRVNDVLVRTINEQMLYSVTDAEGVILEVNDNFCAAFGYARAALIGVHYRLLSSGQHERAFWADMRQTVMAGRTWNGTVCNRTMDGAEKWFDTVVAPYFNEHGVIERYVALHTEVTARRAADSALRHVSALLGNVLRAASEMSVIATDAQGLITVFNTGAERMLGYAAAELVGRSTPAPFHDSMELAARAAELRALTGQPVEGVRTTMLMAERDGAEAREWTYVRKDGSRFPVLLTVTTIRDDSGAVLGFLAIGVDISQRKRDDAILHESIHRAEQASIAKSQFVANMSHEIRTPMNAMLGMLELTLRTELSGRQRDYVEKARGAGTTLLALLNDVLDFSKIDAGKLELDPHVFAVDALLRDLATVLSGNSLNQQVELRYTVAPAIPAYLYGDRQRIGQVLVNLAGNALKFTLAGSVVVEIDVLAAHPGAMTLRFAVTDTGIGIAASQLGMIFDGFTQAEASTARRFGGTGLGLAISTRIVALMGGTLQVSSEVGRGSRFWFDITLGTVADSAAPPAAVAPLALAQRPRRLAGVRLLVVEDNALNRQVAFELLGAEGALVELAEGGQQGIDMALDPARAWDAVIMDVQMPDVDGLEATRRIRAVPRLAQLPIMAMSANVARADRDACLAAGMDSHIGKPFDLDQVVARLRSLIGRNAAPLVDLAGALPRFFDDAALYARMLVKFEQESGQLFARLELEQAQDNACAEAATRHALKGMALTMGVARLAHALAAPAGTGSGHATLRALAAASIQAARAALADCVD